MAGKNLFENRQFIKMNQPSGRSCVFISHKSEDKNTALAVASTITEMGVDIYFDERDELLRVAVENNDDKNIVNCIEDGLQNCTHLLGIITPNTFKSWWVPYEIGSAKGRRKDCVHLISKDVDISKIPSYIKIAPVLAEIDELIKWVSDLPGRSSLLLNETMLKSSIRTLENYVQKTRRRF